MRNNQSEVRVESKIERERWKDKHRDKKKRRKKAKSEHHHLKNLSAQARAILTIKIINQPALKKPEHNDTILKKNSSHRM